MYYRVWIDYNADGDFYDSGEMILEEFVSGGSLKPQSFDIPNDVQTSDLSTTLMRVAARKYDFPEACGEYPYGETEDYPIRIINNQSNKGFGLTVKPRSGALSKNSNMEIFPNPAIDHVFVNLNDFAAKAEILTVTDRFGKVFYQKPLENFKNEAIRVELKNYPSGMYFINLSAKGKHLTSKKLAVFSEN